MIGKKLYKGRFEHKEYADLAVVCNQAGNLTIEDKGEYYEVVEVPVYVPTDAEMKQQLKQAVQSYMDGKAQEKDYDDIVAACSYLNSTDHIFAAEGVASFQHPLEHTPELLLLRNIHLCPQ